MAAAPFDTLKLARALRDKAGFSQEHAEATADALAEVVAEQVATKQDLRDVETRLGAAIGDLRNELRTEIAALRAEIHAAEQRVIIRLGGMLVVMTGILLAARFLG